MSWDLIDWSKKPAIVRYIGETSSQNSRGHFTNGREYEAFFLEYWEGERNSLHVRDDSGAITDFNHFEDFVVLSDENNVLNDFEAIVKCISHDYEESISGLTFGKNYKAIGCDKDGAYLVMDNSYCCYFYPPDVFEIIEDKHDILSHRSVYYSFSNF